MDYLVYPTYQSLLFTYDEVAYRFSKYIEYTLPRLINPKGFLSIDEKGEIQNPQNWHHSNYNYSFSLLILNASILEGVLRSILSHCINQEIETMVHERKKLGHKCPSKIEKHFYAFRNDVQRNGGFEKLKEWYSTFLDISLDKIVSKDISEGIQVLFALRNILAHGTAIVQPKEKMSDDEKDIYPYNWQKSTQTISVYLEKHFNNGSLYDNLAANDVPKHFMEVTSELIKVISSKVDIPDEAKKTVKIISDFDFGFKNFHKE